MTQPRCPHTLRSAADFDAFFAAPDPWSLRGNAVEELRLGLTVAAFRRHVLRSATRRPRVLELGCGEGYFGLRISADCELWVNDISEVALSRIDVEHKLPGDALQLVSDAALLASFDCVVALEMLYYLREEERKAVLVGLARGLRKDALILVSVVVSEDPIYFRPGEFEALFRESGLRLVERHPVTAQWPHVLSRLPLRLKAFLLRYALVAGHQHLFILRRP